MTCRLLLSVIVFAVAASTAAWSHSADEEPSAVGPMMKLLKSGRLPPERLGTVVEMVCRGGNVGDLSYVYQQSIDPKGYAGALRLKAFEGLLEAAQNRKLKATGDLAGLERLVTPDDPQKDPNLQLAAIRLASIWKVEALNQKLQKIVLAKDAREDLQQASIEGLISIGGKGSRETIEQLAGTGHPQRLRYLAVAALARLDVDAAAHKAAAVMWDGTPKDDPAPMIEAFLNRKGAPDKLAAVLAEQPIPADVAKLALRYMYSVGRSDAALSAVFSKAAGIGDDPQPPTPDELKQLASEVATSGNAIRGEKVFRRIDVSCMKCHSVSRAGGDVGPELSSVGAVSPVDYIINSILFPDMAIKELFITKIISTTNGEVFQGIVIDRDKNRIVLKDAGGKEVKVSIADIDEETEGKSLMPKGLAKFLTREELVDLVRFLSELGKPGDYAIPSKPALQRWRYLKPVPKELAAEVPNIEFLREHALDSDHWLPTYAKVAGLLPLDELADDANKSVVYVQGEVNVSEAGQIGFKINSTDGVQTWVDAEPFEAQNKIVVDLPAGRHKITLRVALAERKSKDIKVEPFRVDGSSAQFEAVGGGKHYKLEAQGLMLRLS